MRLNIALFILLAILAGASGVLAVQPIDGSAVTATPDSAQAETSKHPSHEITVLPVFFVPRDEAAPSRKQSSSLMRHLLWSQTRYRELLRGQDTFDIAQNAPAVYKAEHPLGFYKGLPENSAPQVVKELLAYLKTDRTACKYILLTVMMNPHQDFPGGGGRPINGGFDTGGGIVVLSSFALDRFPNFQSTLQHELGHSFGLPHVDVYGYSITTSDSIMGYNPAHHTKDFTPSRTPGIFLPEDLRGLGMNKRAFPDFSFDPDSDIPKGYTLKPVVKLGPMNLPN